VGCDFIISRRDGRGEGKGDGEWTGEGLKGRKQTGGR